MTKRRRRDDRGGYGTGTTRVTSGTFSRKLRSMPIWRVIVLLGQPWQAPWKRICTTPPSLTSTSRMSPPSACTAVRVRVITAWTPPRIDGSCVAGVRVAVDMLPRSLAASGKPSTRGASGLYRRSTTKEIRESCHTIGSHPVQLRRFRPQVAEQRFRGQILPGHAPRELRAPVTFAVAVYVLAQPAEQRREIAGSDLA